MFGPGPSEELRLESEIARHDPVNEDSSKAEYDDHLERERGDAAQGHQPSLVERFKRWFSARF